MGREIYRRFLSSTDEYWTEIERGNTLGAWILYCRLEHLNEFIVRGMTPESHRDKYSLNRHRILWSVLPAILGSIIVIVLFCSMFFNGIPEGLNDQITYNVNLVELLVGGAVGFAAVLAASTYAVNASLRDNPDIPPDGSPPDPDRSPLPLPPSPDRLKEFPIQKL